MTAQAHSLMTFYGGWGSYQRMLVEMLAPLSHEQLALTDSPDQWTVGQLAQHIVGNRVWWFHLWMGEGSPELAPIAHWDPADPEESPEPDAAELVDGLNSSWQMIAGALNRWTADDLPQEFAPPDALTEEEREIFGVTSRKWMIWHVLEHEIHHGGEISLILGKNGLPRIYGDA